MSAAHTCRISCAAIALLAAAPGLASGPCKPGWKHVGNEESRVGNTITVHPVCRPDPQPIAAPVEASGRAPVEWLVLRDTLVEADGTRLPPRPEAGALPFRRELTLRTGPSGEAKLRTADGARVSLGANTSVRFYPRPKRPKRPKMSTFELIMYKGLLKWARDEVDAHNRKMLMRMGGRVVMTIRGTEFEARLDEAGNGSVHLTSGEIGFGKDQAQILKPGQSLTIRSNKIVRVD